MPIKSGPDQEKDEQCSLSSCLFQWSLKLLVDNLTTGLRCLELKRGRLIVARISEMACCTINALLPPFGEIFEVAGTRRSMLCPHLDLFGLPKLDYGCE